MRWPLSVLLLAAALPAAADTPLDRAWSDPPPEARVRAYWWWLNGHVDAAAITRDLEGMKAKGFGGAVIFDAGGADQNGNRPVPAGPAFGSPAWRALLRHALAEGDRLGLELSLNIQSGWDLGGPSVTADDAVKKYVWSEATAEGSGAIRLPDPPRTDGYYRDAFVVAYPLRPGRAAPSGGVADWKVKALQEPPAFSGPDAWFRVNSAPPTSVLTAAEAGRPGEEDAAASDVIDLTGRLRPDGGLDWRPPAGRWEILRLGYTLADNRLVSTHSDGWDGYALDVFDEGAFRRYWTRVVAPILEDARPWIGRSLRYLYSDSWEVNLVDWTPNLRAEFRARRGYDLVPYLPVLAGRIVGSRAESDRFLDDYRRTLGDLVVDRHFRPYRELAASRGLGLHPEAGGPHYTPIDSLRCLGLGDFPMSEFWAASKTHRTSDESRFFVKQPASAAHVYGRRLVAAEGFTSVGPQWQETLWDNLKPSFDHAIAEGLNRLVWHAFVCSPASMGLPGQQYFAGTHFNPEVTWWDESGPFLAYLNRCQALMQRGRFVADAVYYYGDHVPNYAQLRASDPARLGPGYDYDVIPEDALVGRLEAKEGSLVLPDGMSYPVLVLPDEPTISPAALAKVRDLVRGGARVAGPRPGGLDTLTGGPESDAAARRLIAELWAPGARNGVVSDRTARQLLEDAGIGPDVECLGPAGLECDTMHRRDGDADLYFIANRKGGEARFEARFRVRDRAPELWDAVTGGRRFAAAYREEGGTTAVPLELPPYGSIFVIFREPAAARPPSAPDNEARFAARAGVAGPWTVGFDPRWGGPASARFPSLVDWTARPEPGIRHYSGRAAYRTSFSTAGLPAGPLWLDLGRVREIAEVKLNGRSLGILWAPPFRVDLTPALRPGENALEVDVVNFWPNRIIGDAGLPPDRRFTRTNIATLKADTALMPSGLLGPVTLISPLP